MALKTNVSSVDIIILTIGIKSVFKGVLVKNISYMNWKEEFPLLSEKVLKPLNEIVDDCMGDADPACVASCPMHTNVKKYVNLIGEGKGKEAVEVIREKLFLPKTLGRICAHPCEENCKRNEVNSPLAVASLKRYAADNFDDPNNWDLDVAEDNDKKIAVIGAGPAGAQAALDLRREGYSVTVYDRLEVYGGMMRVGIPEYRLPRDIIDSEYSLLEKIGVEFKMGVEIGKDIDFNQLREDYDAVIVAVGKHQGRIDRSLENHDADGIYHAAEYLKEISLTQAFDGVGKKVAVIGGGDVAMDCARSSLRLAGVEEVHAVCLESTYDEMASSMHEINGALNEGVNFNLAYGTHKITIDKDGRVSGLELKECTTMFDKDGNFAPEFNENNKKALDVDTVIFAIGQGVDSSFDNEDVLTKRRNGTFECDPLTMQSASAENVFVAGDASGTAFIVVGAMAEGRRAAKSADRYLNAKDLKEGRVAEEEGSYTTKLDIPLDWDNLPKPERVHGQELDPKERIKSFDEVEFALSQELAEKEAERCLQCECRLCMGECVMLNDFCHSPKDLFAEVMTTGDIDPLIPYSCNMCSQCTIVCPNDFKIKDKFMKMRKEMVKNNNGKSPIKGHGAIEMHQFLGFSKLFNIAKPAKDKK
ncbi:NADPH-dependent glutamate synthase beta subunit-like oxidoreductase [Orenia marismortui]|uniref:NADPH-dependent glutamate synthase beta subunit-like oxidoreductase n=2 Tax=Orenia marismortui TaxID=46469 RepID=A0A4R8GR76_9FIRM|nr:NADPH-dependent glutamate synthase beta subunit-like oxidoreductase [Orenia marismortui]